MYGKKETLACLQRELNPELEAIYLEGEEEELPQGLLPPEALKEKRKADRLTHLDLNGKQSALYDGLAALEKLNPTLLDKEEQKRFLEGMEGAKSKALEAIAAPFPDNASIAEICGVSPYVMACMWKMANICFLNKHFEEAASIYGLILYLDESLDAIWVAYAQCLRACGEIDKAENAFRKANKLNPNNPDSLIGETQCALDKNDHHGAAKCLAALKALTGKQEEYQDIVNDLTQHVKKGG